jgi:hypothetical protein
MTDMITITDVKPREGLSILVTFSDGAIKEVDLSDLMGRGGVFDPIRASRSLFESVQVNPESETVEWPGEIDLDPEVLYGLFEPAAGPPLKRRTLREPTASSRR